VVLFELYQEGKITIEKIVKKTSHDVAEAYRIRDRGYIREGYYADLVLIDLDEQWTVSNDNILYGCKWSPLLNHTFKGKIKHVMVNGNHYLNGEVKETHSKGMRLKFGKNR
jgi:dihydroorotase